jgi:hypothetical protein
VFLSDKELIDGLPLKQIGWVRGANYRGSHNRQVSWHPSKKLGAVVVLLPTTRQTAKPLLVSQSFSFQALLFNPILFPILPTCGAGLALIKVVNSTELNPNNLSNGVAVTVLPDPDEKRVSPSLRPGD